MYGIVVNPGEVSNVVIKQVEDLGLKELYRLTDCDCIAVARPQFDYSKDLGYRINMVYDDEFLINGKEKVINKLCSYLYGYALYGECLCGKVAIVKLNDNGDDFIPFSKEEADQVKKLLEKIASWADKEDYVLHQPIVRIIGSEESKCMQIFDILRGKNNVVNEKENLDD